MDIQDLSFAGKKKLLNAITKGLSTYFKSAGDDNEEFLGDVLVGIVSTLDEWDGHDAWGTEGWRYTFGVA